MNIDGATAVIFAKRGFTAPLAGGLFCLSRSGGIPARVWEQSLEPARNKGPMPKEYLWNDQEPALPHLVQGRGIMVRIDLLFLIVSLLGRLLSLWILWVPPCEQYEQNVFYRGKVSYLPIVYRVLFPLYGCSHKSRYS